MSSWNLNTKQNDHIIYWERIFVYIFFHYLFLKTFHSFTIKPQNHPNWFWHIFRVPPMFSFPWQFFFRLVLTSHSPTQTANGLVQVSAKGGKHQSTGNRTKRSVCFMVLDTLPKCFNLPTSRHMARSESTMKRFLKYLLQSKA